MNTYRVFVTRYYIAVEFYDIEAANEKQARKAAVKAARELKSDVRAEAVDNQWQVEDEPVEIPNLGYSAAPFDPELVHESKYGRVYK